MGKAGIWPPNDQVPTDDYVTVQVTAEKISSAAAAREVFMQIGSDTELSDGAARTIAHEWAYPGSVGSYLHKLSVGMPTPLTAILDDIRGVRRDAMLTTGRNALDMLATWAIAASKRPSDDCDQTDEDTLIDQAMERAGTTDPNMISLADKLEIGGRAVNKTYENDPNVTQVERDAALVFAAFGLNGGPDRQVGEVKIYGSATYDDSINGPIADDFVDVEVADRGYRLFMVPGEHSDAVEEFMRKLGQADA